MNLALLKSGRQSGSLPHSMSGDCAGTVPEGHQAFSGSPPSEWDSSGFTDRPCLDQPEGSGTAWTDNLPQPRFSLFACQQTGIWYLCVKLSNADGFPPDVQLSTGEGLLDPWSTPSTWLLPTLPLGVYLVDSQGLCLSTKEKKFPEAGDNFVILKQQSENYAEEVASKELRRRGQYLIVASTGFDVSRLPGLDVYTKESVWGKDLEAYRAKGALRLEELDSASGNGLALRTDECRCKFVIRRRGRSFAHALGFGSRGSRVVIGAPPQLKIQVTNNKLGYVAFIKNPYGCPDHAETERYHVGLPLSEVNRRLSDFLNRHGDAEYQVSLRCGCKGSRRVAEFVYLPSIKEIEVDKLIQELPGVRSGLVPVWIAHESNVDVQVQDKRLKVKCERTAHGTLVWLPADESHLNTELAVRVSVGPKLVCVLKIPVQAFRWCLSEEKGQVKSWGREIVNIPISRIKATSKEALWIFIPPAFRKCLASVVLETDNGNVLDKERVKNRSQISFPLRQLWLPRRSRDFYTGDVFVRMVFRRNTNRQPYRFAVARIQLLISCRLCQAEFHEEAVAENHIWDVHRGELVEEKITPPPGSLQLCMECGKFISTSSQAMDEHMWSVCRSKRVRYVRNPEEIEHLWRLLGPRVFLCKQCGTEGDEKMIRQHLLMEQGVYH